MVRGPRLAAYGHSWVAGEGATTPAYGFVQQVAAAVGAVPLDRAVGGSSTRDTAVLVGRDGPPAADLYLLMAGLNDARLDGLEAAALRVYESALQALLGAFRAASPGAPVVMVQQPPLLDYSGYPPHNHGSDAALSAHNRILCRVAAAGGGTVVTIAGWDPAAMLDVDAVHPNDAGHAVIAASVLAVLDRSSIAATRPVQD